MKNQIGLAFRCLLAFVFAVIFAGHVSAQLFWAGAGLNPATSGSGTWDNANMQWSNTFPAYTGATWDSNIANFNGTSGGTVTLGANISVNDINFGANAGAFTLLNSGVGQFIDILGTGITNNSANTQTITNSGVGSFTIFNNNATAANASITNSGSSSFTRFFDSATAANASITNSGSTSFTEFFSNATAGNAAITNSGSGSATEFVNSASGGNATLINANPTAQIDISGLSTTGTTAGSIAGNGFLNLGSKNLAVGSNNTSTTFSGVIRDGGFFVGVGGSLTKVGTGTLILSGTNTYTGDTNIDGGVLQIDGSITSNTFVNSGGTLSGTGTIFGNLTNSGVVGPGDSSTGTLTVNGNYTQNSNGTLQIEIGGLNAGVNSDLLQVNGAGGASLNGTLQLIRINNFTPAPGDRVNIINDPNGHTGVFSNVMSTFPGLIQPIPMYNEPADIYVVFQLSPFTSVPGLTFNQNAVAVALNQAFADARLPLSTFTIMGNRPIATLPHIFDLIAPEEFAAMYEISFSRAVVQSGNLQGRMDQIRENADPNCEPIMEINPAPEGKNVVGKNVVPPAPAPGPDNRWGTFAMGSGDYVTVHNQDDNANGYKITNGSFLAGVDYRLLHNLAIGVYGGYVGSESNLVGNGRIITDGETVGGYATFFCHGFYLQASGGGGWNDYENRREAFLTAAQSSTTGSEVNAMGALGYDWTMNFNAANHPGSLTVGPIASVQYTNVNIDGFHETGSLIPLEFPDQSEDSLRSTIGGKVAICIQTDHGIMLRPEARVAWLHEYNDRAYPIDARFIGSDDLFTVRGPRIGGDAAQVTAGMTVQFNPMVALFAHYEGIFGRDNYDSNGVSGGLALSF